MHQIQTMEGNVSYTASATALHRILQIVRRPLDSRDVPSMTNDLGQVTSCITGPSADIQYPRASRDTSSGPAIEYMRSPHGVLKTKTLQLGLVRAQHIVAVLGSAHR